MFKQVQGYKTYKIYFVFCRKKKTLYRFGITSGGEIMDFWVNYNFMDDFPGCVKLKLQQCY